MRLEARAALDIDPKARVVAFLAPELEKGRKGGHYLQAALEALPNLSGATLLLVGKQNGKPLSVPGWIVRSVRYSNEDEQLAEFIAAADLLAAPSVADNFPNTLVESLACGTPVVAFDVGGVGEAVRHMETGYLARAHDPGDLAAGVRLVLEDDDLQARLGAGARHVALAEYSRELELARFMSLYAELGKTARSTESQYGKRAPA